MHYLLWRLWISNHWLERTKRYFHRVLQIIQGECHRLNKANRVEFFLKFVFRRWFRIKGFLERVNSRRSYQKCMTLCMMQVFRDFSKKLEARLEEVSGDQIAPVGKDNGTPA